MRALPLPNIVQNFRFAGIVPSIALIFLLLANVSPANASTSICVKGLADLRNNESLLSSAVQLDGEWEFYWQELLSGDAAPRPGTYTPVPGMWAAAGLEGQGFATYRLQVLLPHGLTDIGLKIPEFSTAYTLRVNGEIRAQNGTVSAIPEEGQACYAPQLIYLSAPKDTLAFVLQVSNYAFYTGGVPQSILIGNYQVLASLREAQVGYGAMLFGILLIIGIFHLGIYYFRPKEKYNLYYSLYCLLLAANTLFVTERWIFAIGGAEMWPLLYKVYIAMIYLVLLMLILFYSAFFQPVIARWITRSMAVIFVFQALLVIALPTKLGSWLEPLAGINLVTAGIIAIFIFAKAILKRKEGAVIIAICNIVFLVSFVLDGQLSANQISGIHISHYTTVLYVIAISLILSRRIANAFTKVETLSLDLQSANTDLTALNKNLEAEVKDRTRQVLQQEKLAALGQLTANIAHEINTPMGAIKASIETLSISYRKALELFPSAMDALTTEEREILSEMLLQVLSSREYLSSREERKKRQEVGQLLENAGVPDALVLASKFSHAGIHEFDNERIALLRKPGIGVALAYLFENFEQITSAQNIQFAMERVSKIMFAIKIYSRGGSSTAKTEVELEQEIVSITALYSNWFKKGIVLKTDFAQMPPLACLADEMLQVWTNLILNAVQAMGSSGTLEIKTRMVGNAAEVTIADTGPGIPDEIIGKIFDPFFTTKGTGEGSGLGLDIVRSIVTRHHGTITVSSQPGNTVFTVTIPYRSN
jgi:signal transduction histidine kinase